MPVRFPGRFADFGRVTLSRCISVPTPVRTDPSQGVRGMQVKG